MATYRNYAENLIGNWNTDQYNPQKEATIAAYNTNWDKLQNDFTTYMEKLNRNLKSARTNYHDALANATENSYLRNNAALGQLANKGLIGSGIAQNYAGADTAARGAEITDALSKIINTNTGYIGSLENAVASMYENQDKLNRNLAKALGGITDDEENNLQRYANLAANLSGSAEGRELSNALAKAKLSLSSNRQSAQDEEDELERRQRIYDTLVTDKMSDSEKVRNMSIYLDVPADIGEELLKAYKNNQTLAKDIETNAKQNKIIERYQNKLNKYNDYKSDTRRSKDQTAIGMSAWGDLKDILGIERYAGGGVSDALSDYYQKRISDAQSKIKPNLGYEDLYNILYGNR